jgi:hypothetical protein
MKTKSPRPATLAKAQAGIQAAYLRTFDCQSCDARSNAQRNLSGRCHYADDGTLRYFKASILNSGHSPDGLVFWIVESVNSRPDHGGRNKRFVAFDLWGTVLTRDDHETGEGWHRTSADAYKAGEAWMAGFDAAAHTVDTLAARAKRDIVDAHRVLAALKAKPTATV